MKSQTRIFHIEKDGKIEFHHTKVPQSEITVLKYLGSNSMTAPQICRASNGIIKISSIYTLLKRLSEKKLVKEEEILLTVAGDKVKRVTYTATFIKMEK